MSAMLSVDSKKRCPYCGHEETVRNFMTWEDGHERGALGKTPDGFMMILCPKCKNHIKYDTLGDTFLKAHQRAQSTYIFNAIFFGVVLVILYFVAKLILKF